MVRDTTSWRRGVQTLGEPEQICLASFCRVLPGPRATDFSHLNPFLGTQGWANFLIHASWIFHLELYGCGSSHFGIGAPPIFAYFIGDWGVHWGYGVLTLSHIGEINIFSHKRNFLGSRTLANSRHDTECQFKGDHPSFCEMRFVKLGPHVSCSLHDAIGPPLSALGFWFAPDDSTS